MRHSARRLDRSRSVPNRAPTLVLCEYQSLKRCVAVPQYGSARAAIESIDHGVAKRIDGLTHEALDTDRRLHVGRSGAFRPSLHKIRRCFPFLGAVGWPVGSAPRASRCYRSDQEGHCHKWTIRNIDASFQERCLHRTAMPLEFPIISAWHRQFPKAARDEAFP